jgi:hypothetical protein
LLAAVGFAAMVLLTTVLGYPVSMLGVDGAVRTNNAPPSLALVALGVAQVGLVLSVRGPLQRWLDRPAVWARVVMGGTMAMTLYLWHMTAMVAGIGIAFGLGLLPEVAFDATWWLTRPLWLAFLAVLLVPLVAVFRRSERAAPARPRPTTPGSVLVNVAGVSAVCAGLALLILDGLHVPGAPLGVPVGSVAALAGGLLALGVIRGRPFSGG